MFKKAFLVSLLSMAVSARHQRQLSSASTSSVNWRWQPSDDFTFCKKKCGKNFDIVLEEKPKKAECKLGGKKAGGETDVAGKIRFEQTKKTSKWPNCYVDDDEQDDDDDYKICRDGVEQLSKVVVHQGRIIRIPQVNGKCSKEMGSDVKHGIHVHVKAPKKEQDCDVTGPHFWPGKELGSDDHPDHVLRSFDAKKYKTDNGKCKSKNFKPYHSDTIKTMFGDDYNNKNNEDEDGDKVYEYTTESIINRSVTLHKVEEGNPRLACCRIREVIDSE